jgi:hypothetical protein
MIDWKIISIKAKAGFITSAEYSVTATDGKHTIETRGNWEINKPTPIEQVKERYVVEWIKADIQEHIEQNLLKQLETVQSEVVEEVPLPWKFETFTVSL